MVRKKWTKKGKKKRKEKEEKKKEHEVRTGKQKTFCKSVFYTEVRKGFQKGR